MALIKVVSLYKPGFYWIFLMKLWTRVAAERFRICGNVIIFMREHVLKDMHEPKAISGNRIKA